MLVYYLNEGFKGMLVYYLKIQGMLVYYLNEEFKACWFTTKACWFTTKACWFTTLMKDSRHAGLLPQ